MKKFIYQYNTYNNTEADSVCVYEYDTPQLKFFIAIDNTDNGPAVGACRFINGTPRETALIEVCKMARTMTEKNIIAGLPYGGGKAFIYHSGLDKMKMLKVFAEVLNELNGMYYTTNDIGTSIDDMDYIRQSSPYAKGIKHEGVVVPATAYGVYLALKVAAKHVFGTSELKGRNVALQGVGSVGLPMLEFLLRDGCNVIVDDINKTLLAQLKKEYSFVEATKDFATYDVDIIVPCAIGGVINHSNIENITAKLIVGGANNQLADNEIDDLLFNKGILFIPDMLANYGGMIDLYCEGPNYCQEYVFEHIQPICQKVEHFINEASIKGISVNKCLNEWVRNKVLNKF